MTTETNSIVSKQENRTLDELKILFENALTLNKEIFLALKNKDNNKIKELILLGAPFSLFNLGKTHEEVKQLFNLRDKDKQVSKNFEKCFFIFHQWIEENPNYLKLVLKHSHFTKRLNKEIWSILNFEEIKNFISNNNNFLLESHNIRYMFQDNAKLDLFLSYSQSIKNLTDSIYRKRGLTFLIELPSSSFQKIFESLTFKRNYHTTLINNLLKESLYFEVNILDNTNIKKNINEENDKTIKFMNSMYAEYITVISKDNNLDIQNMKKIFPKVFQPYFELSNNLSKKENMKKSYKI